MMKKGAWRGARSGWRVAKGIGVPGRRRRGGQEGEGGDAEADVGGPLGRGGEEEGDAVCDGRLGADRGPLGVTLCALP